MRIGFDLRPFLKEETGVGVYVRSLLAALARLDAEDEFFLFSASWKDRFPRDRVPSFARGRFLDRRIPVRLLDSLWSRLEWPTLDSLFGIRLDLTHSPSPLVLPTKGKKIVTVHDLFFLERPEMADRQARTAFARKIGRDVRAADGVVAVSEFTRGQVLERFGLEAARVRAIPHGLAEVWRRAPERSDLDRLRRDLDLPERFLLFVGAVEPRKNLPRLLEAVLLLSARGLRTPLVIVGRPGGDSGRVSETLRRRGLDSLVRVLGYLDEDRVRCLHRLATVLVFPSLFEGFGLPVIEAMASGLPVAASNTSAIPEVAGGAALLFDPLRTEDIAEKVGLLWEDESFRESLIDKGRRRAEAFDWKRSAALTLEFYHAL
jgi:glycosyltransferase involved in cell wall biosynthesis